MDGMDMSSGGMDMGGADLFQITNRKIAKIFWYFVAAVVAVLFIRRLCDIFRTIYAKRTNASRQDVPSRPSTFVTQFYDTVNAIAREVTYPQLRPFTGSFSKYFSILSSGQALLLLAYWVMILIMLWSNTILAPSSMIYGYKWEIVAFRAAWVSVTQIPLLYCLGGKANAISLITGISYERLNWLHRWVARTIFLTVIVHWTYFFREWWLADFVKDELAIMPMVKYGFGAWAVLGWSVITGFGFFRTKCYELWVLQHLATAGVLLWLLFVHVPSYARYNIWLSIGFVALDRGIRGIWSVVRNLHLTGLWKKVAGNQSLIGFDASAESHGDGYMSLSIKNTDFSWQPGQHVFISIPVCGIFESHPFTISNTAEHGQNLELYFKCHDGFTARLQKRAESGKADDLRTFVSGPWGNTPISKIERCNSLIFVASSTGASFSVQLLEHAIKEAKFVRRISFHWIVRHDSQLRVFMPRVTAALEYARQQKIEAECHIFITQAPGSLSSNVSEKDITTATPTNEVTLSKSSTDSVLNVNGKSQTAKDNIADVRTSVRSTGSSSQTPSVNSDSNSEKQHIISSNVSFCQGRPQSWDNLLHPTIVEAEGETVIVACGGGTLMADIRNYVAWVSDQRAVHKGTGAQGIALFTETYGW